MSIVRVWLARLVLQERSLAMLMQVVTVRIHQRDVFNTVLAELHAPNSLVDSTFLGSQESFRLKQGLGRSQHIPADFVTPDGRLYDKRARF